MNFKGEHGAAAKQPDLQQLRVKPVLIFGSVVILLLGVAVYAINRYVSEIGAQYIVGADEVTKADVILVLGAWVQPDGSLSYALDNRLSTGYELYKKGKADKVIVSGDHGQKDYDEVNAMKRYLLDRQVPAEHVFMDHAGFTTYESLYRARDVFKAQKVILVTQQYHLKRAVFIARELGLEAYGVMSDDGNPDLVTRWDKGREVCARIKAFLFTKIYKPKPTFLGEEIPITGDGRATDDK